MTPHTTSGAMQSFVRNEQTNACETAGISSAYWWHYNRIAFKQFKPEAVKITIYNVDYLKKVWGQKLMHLFS